MTKYVYTSEQTRQIKALKASIRAKIAAGWGREDGAGFIAEDIRSILLERPNKKYPSRVIITMKSAFKKFMTLDQGIGDYNLRETEELLRFVQEVQPLFLRSGFEIAKAMRDLKEAIELSPRIMMSDNEYNAILGMHADLGEAIKGNRIWGL